MKYTKVELNGKTHQQLVEIILELQEKANESNNKNSESWEDFHYSFADSKFQD